MTSYLQVEIEEIFDEPTMTSGCVFCEKIVDTYQEEYEQHKALGRGYFYCAFCLRHGNHHADAKLHKLQLSFRGLIGYYYFHLYKGDDRSIYLSEINQYVKEHVRVGLEHPAYSYDPDTLNWIIDFRMIGNSKHKFPLESIHENNQAIFEAFETSVQLPGVNTDSFLEKIDKAVDLYASQRQRPRNKKLLCPSLINCSGIEQNINFEELKNIPSFFLK